MAQLRAFWAEVVRGGCSGLKKYMSALPSSLIISSFAPNKVTPFFRKNLAASLVPVLQCLICLIHCHLWWPSRREQHKDAPYSSIIYIYPNQHMDLISYLYNTWICLNSKLLAPWSNVPMNIDTCIGVAQFTTRSKCSSWQHLHTILRNLHVVTVEFCILHFLDCSISPSVKIPKRSDSVPVVGYFNLRASSSAMLYDLTALASHLPNSTVQQ